MEQRTCLVTGAGRGIGAAVARRLGEQGHRVALTARNAAELEQVAAASPGPTLTVAADITDPAAVEHVFGTVEQEWGPVETLVLSAGGAMSAPLARTSDEDWARMLDLNLTAPFRCLRRAVPSMTERGWGRIVVIASVAAKRGEPYIAGYTAAKHGVLGLVRSAASELAKTGVTVNAVCPAYVDTPMTAGTIETISARTGRSPQEARAILEARQPHGRLVTADEVADVVLFCLAAGGVTGQGLNVDGGAVQS